MLTPRRDRMAGHAMLTVTGGATRTQQLVTETARTRNGKRQGLTHRRARPASSGYLAMSVTATDVTDPSNASATVTDKLTIRQRDIFNSSSFRSI